MVFRNFSFQIIIQLIIIVTLAGICTYFFINGSPEISILGCLLIITDAIILVSSFNSTNRSLAYFFESIENEDTQIRLYSKKKNKSLQRLHDSMNRVNKLITDIKLQNQRNEQYYKALIQQSATGLIAMSTENNIEIANETACELVGILASINFRRLETKNPALWSLLCNIKPGEFETIKITRENNYVHLLIRSTNLRFNDREIKLISIQDIKLELDAKETESWQKLISILTHEIMNSIAPITSLTTTLTRFFKKDELPVPVSEINEKVIENVIQGLEIIGERGSGLLNFVTSYRRLTKIPTPLFRDFLAHEWLNNTKILLFEKFEENNITLEININRQIRSVMGDEKLLTQVLINLIYNAIDALSDKHENKIVRISIERANQNQVKIVVANNGNPIPEDIQDKIFVPFFTTKEKGSGIGLSLSRQIIQLHHGYIYVESDQSETRFIIIF